MQTVNILKVSNLYFKQGKIIVTYLRFFFALFILSNATIVVAEERIFLGHSWYISNDSIGDYHDRWQSSSVQTSIFFGPEWSGKTSGEYGEILEFRIRADHLTPERLVFPRHDDRRHAGVLSFGVHSHMSKGAWDIVLGGDVVVIGPQTGLLDFQTKLHEILGFTIPQLDGFQIEDQVQLNLAGEVGRSWVFGQKSVRPFVEGAVGPEDYLRLGVDVTFGDLGQDSLFTRAHATGQRTPALRIGKQIQTAFTLGFDSAYVADSVYLPSRFGHELTPLRHRIRANFHRSWRHYTLSYGLTWLSPEFEAQRSGQFVGTIGIAHRF